MADAELPVRVRLAVEALRADASRRILEVGCGGGLALTLLAERFPGAVVVGIDRSATQVAKARRRVETLAATGRPTVELLSLAAASAQWRATPFDRVLAINVNAFWTESAISFPAVAQLLAPRGALVLAYEPPTTAGLGAFKERVIQAALSAHWVMASRPEVHDHCVVFCLRPPPEGA